MDVASLDLTVQRLLQAGLAPSTQRAYLTVQRLLQAGLAPSTQRAYLAGKKKYMLFCQDTVASNRGEAG